MLAHHRMALKEWAVVVWALGRGLQLFLLRKGGIAEPEGRFEPRHREFFLYPTYEHQQAALLQPQFAELFHALAARTAAERPLALQHCAVVTDVFPAPPLPRLQPLRDEFVWNDAYLQQRYRYKPELPLSLLLVRVYSLPEPVRLPERDEYAGCRSWVELEESVPTAGAVPVLGEEEFLLRRESLLERLGAPVMAKP